MTLNVVTDIEPAKVKELQALVAMLPSTMTGYELHTYLQLVLANFCPDAANRMSMVEFLHSTERQLALMTIVGLDNFPTKEA